MHQVVLIENKLPSKDAFVKAFDKETGGDFKKLMSNSPTRDGDTCLYWDVMMPNGNYELKYCADNPFFILSKEVE